MYDGAACITIGLDPPLISVSIRFAIPAGAHEVARQSALGDGDEAIAEPVEPELRSARIADTTVDVRRILNMADGDLRQVVVRWSKEG